jgi:hypothetical protein
MKTFCFNLFILFAINGLAQEKPNKIKEFFNGDLDYCPTITAELQTLKYCSASIGFGASKLPEPHSGEPLGIGIIFNNEFIFRNANKNFVYSPQFNVFINYSYFYAGAKFSYYTDFQNGGTLQFAPEIGLGLYFISIVYSRNIAIKKNKDIPVNKNNLSIKVMLPLEVLF